MTARNSGGEVKVDLALSVQSVFLNVGHGTGVGRVRLGNSRVLSHDGFHVWALWNEGTTALVATGSTDCLQPRSRFNDCNPTVDMAGSIFVAEKRGALEIRSPADGSRSRR